MWVPEGPTSFLAGYLILVLSQWVLHPPGGGCWRGSREGKKAPGRGSGVRESVHPISGEGKINKIACEHGVHKAGSNWFLHFSRRWRAASSGVACKASRATSSGKSCDHVGRWRVSHDSVLCDAVRSNRRRLPPLAHRSSWCSSRLLQGSPAAVQRCALRWCVLLPLTVSTSRGSLH